MTVTVTDFRRKPKPGALRLFGPTRQGNGKGKGTRIREIALELNMPLSSETRSRLLRELIALSVGL